MQTAGKIGNSVMNIRVAGVVSQLPSPCVDVSIPNISPDIALVGPLSECARDFCLRVVDTGMQDRLNHDAVWFFAD
jgi:hypothetical protein